MNCPIHSRFPLPLRHFGLAALAYLAFGLALFSARRSLLGFELQARFVLGVVQRRREVGVLLAIGFAPGDVQRGLMRESLLLAAIGGLLGTAGAIGFAAIVMRALRTWWAGAVGTTALRLHVDPAVLAIGVLGGTAAAIAVLSCCRSSISTETR